MTRALPISAYTDCEEAYERAMASANGITLTFARPGLAVRFRQKLHKYRVLLRDASLLTYPEGHPQRGLCAYDNITCKHIPGEATLRLQVEDLTFTVTED